MCELEHVVVRREWKHIDILLLVDTRSPQGVRRLAVIIENKVDSGERADQLAAYYQEVRRRYRDREIIGVYLTPAGYAPAEKTVPYTPLAYATVHDILEDIVRREGAGPTNDVVTAVRHYAALLRRDIIPESEIARLCRDLYRRHPQAINLIVAHLPDRFEEVGAVFQRLIQESGDLFSIMYCARRFTHVSVEAWKGIPPLQADKTGVPILFLCFDADERHVILSLQIGPGDEAVRRRLVQVAREHPDILCQPLAMLKPEYQMIYHTELLPSWPAGSTREELYAEIKGPWELLVEPHGTVEGEQDDKDGSHQGCSQ